MSLTGYERLPLESQRRLDDACSRFERSWAGPSPDRMAEELAAAPAEETEVWLTELLHIEIERARRAGAVLPAADYRVRLPAQSDAIEAVFAEFPAAVGLGDSIGKYRLTQQIGRGRSGTVFEAEDTVIGRRVAVKLLTGPSAASRTVQEARSVGRLQHPNIVTVHDAGSADGVWYIAMELLAGTTADRLKAGESFAPEEATRIIADVCRGLAAAHAAGLVHRDIKPANILLASLGVSGPEPAAKLSDFGLAVGQRDSDETDVVAGTPLYMAPEQFDGREVVPACDIYSLGATYFALLTGRPPYRANSTAELRNAHETAPTPVATASSGKVLEGHSRVVARAMAKAPADRYASAAEMLADLEALSPRRPIPVRRSRRVAFIGVTAVLLAALALAVPGPVEWIASHLRWNGTGVSGPVATPAWQPLFNGRDLGGWVAFARPDGAWIQSDRTVSIVVDGEPAIQVGGSSAGSIVTDREFENYHLRLEIRWPASDPPCSGSLRYHVTGAQTASSDAGGWDEFSLTPATMGEYRHAADRTAHAAVFRLGRLVPLAGPPKAPMAGLAQAGTRWHRIDLASWGGLTVLAVNGTVVSSRARSPSAGAQAHGRGRIEIRAARGSIDVRRIEVRPVAGIPAEFQGRER